MKVSLEENVGISRLETYEFIRFLAVSMVVIVHTAQIFSKNHVFDRAYPALELGKHGVCLFFILSGYLLSKSLARTSCSPVTYKKYVLRRLLRIYPTYFVVLVILVVIQHPSSLQIHSHIFLVHTITRETFGGINYPFWLLSVEFLIFLLIPPMVWIATKYRALFVFFIATGTGILWQTVGGYFRSTYGFDPNYEVSSVLFVLTTIPAFAIGVYAKKLQAASQTYNFLIVLCIAIVIFDIAGAVTSSILDIEIRFSLFINLMHGSASYLAYGIVFLILVTAVERWNLKNRALRGCVLVGEMSYSIYLIHVPILLFFVDHIDASLLTSLIAIVVILIISKITYVFLEKPIMRISRKSMLRY